MKKIFLFLFFFLLVPTLALAQTIEDVTLESTGLSTTIQITDSWTFEKIELGYPSKYILFHNLSYTNSNAEGRTNITSLNYTQTGKTLVSNDFPYVSDSLSDNQVKHIYNNISQTVNADVVFDVFSCDIESIAYRSHSGAYSKTYFIGGFTCNNKLVTLSVIGIETTTTSNNIILTYSAGVIGGSGTTGTPTGCIEDYHLEDGECVKDTIAYVIKEDLPFFQKVFKTVGMLSNYIAVGIIIGIIWLFYQDKKKRKETRRT